VPGSVPTAARLSLAGGPSTAAGVGVAEGEGTADPAMTSSQRKPSVEDQAKGAEEVP
jgi:hypothetical protein